MTGNPFYTAALLGKPLGLKGYSGPETAEIERLWDERSAIMHKAIRECRALSLEMERLAEDIR